jgi:hypothetical protein
VAGWAISGNIRRQHVLSGHERDFSNSKTVHVKTTVAPCNRRCNCAITATGDFGPSETSGERPKYSLRLDRKRENARVQANPQNFLNLRQNRLVTDLSVNHQNRVLKEGATQDVRGRVDIPRSSEFS